MGGAISCELVAVESASCVVQEARLKLQNEHDEAIGKLKTTEALEMKIKDLETSLAEGSVCCPPVGCISASHRARVSLQRRQQTLRRQMRRQQRMRSMWKL